MDKNDIYKYITQKFLSFLFDSKRNQKVISYRLIGNFKSFFSILFDSKKTNINM